AVPLMTMFPSVTCPSPPRATSSPRRTQTMVVACHCSMWFSRVETTTWGRTCGTHASGSVSGELLAHFAAFLGFQRQGGRGAGEQAGDADGLAGFLAPAVFAGVDAGNGLLDFLQQLAFAVAGTQFQGVFFFDRCAVGRVGHVLEIGRAPV